MSSTATSSDPVMSNFYDAPFGAGHDHVFLGAGHDKNERKTWAVIVLCAAMMVAEIVGGSLFGSIALVADGLHMSTHAGAMLIAALAYTYARRHANDRRFVFGTGKLGDLAGFTSAIILSMIALLILYEAGIRLFSPVPIHFAEAIPIAVVGLGVNLLSAWLLSGGDHHGHDHAHGTAEHSAHEAEVQRVVTPTGVLALSIFEQGVPPVFRIHQETAGAGLPAGVVTVTTIRASGAREVFEFSRKSNYLESINSIPEPHGFEVVLSLPEGDYRTSFQEHDHGEPHHVDSRDHNMRAAYVHVIADAAVSVLAIVGLVLAKVFGWLWMDPLAGIVGALVIANWAFVLIRDTGGILLDVSRDDRLANNVRAAIEAGDDELADLHVWRLGPGHMGAVASVMTDDPRRGADFYHALLRRFSGISHVTVEVRSPTGRSR